MLTISKDKVSIFFSRMIIDGVNKYTSLTLISLRCVWLSALLTPVGSIKFSLFALEYITQNGRSTKRGVPLELPYRSGRARVRLKNRRWGRKRTRKLVQSYSERSPWAAPGREGRPHRCEMHLIYVRKWPINWRNRHAYANATRRVAFSWREVAEMPNCAYNEI